MVRRLLDERHFTINVRSTAQPNTAKLLTAAAVHRPAAQLVYQSCDCVRPASRMWRASASLVPIQAAATRRGAADGAVMCDRAQLECNQLDTELYDVQIVVDKRSPLESLFAKVNASALPALSAPLL